jgi:hypothetical protein
MTAPDPLNEPAARAHATDIATTRGA